jgi:glycosyltransferase involved in cell wall biosynthesis
MSSDLSFCCEQSWSTEPRQNRRLIKCGKCGFQSCIIHIYIGPQNEWRCYQCFAELDSQDRAAVSLVAQGKVAAPENPRAHVVIVIHGLHICGAARHCLELLRAFNASYVYTTVVAQHGGGQWATMFLENTNELILHTSPSVDGRELDKIRWRASRRIISAHYDPAISWTTSMRHDADLYAHFHTEPEYGYISRSTLLHAGALCHSVLFPSSATMGSYEHLVVPLPDWWADKCEVLPNATPTSLAWSRSHFDNRSSAEFRLAIVSRLDPDKISFPLLIDTLLILYRSSLPLKVRIAGNGTQGEYFNELLRQNGLSDVVEVMGWVDDVGEVYGWADATFLPSHSETMPYAAIESVHSTRPVVLPALGHFSGGGEWNDLIQTFTPGSPQAAAQAILRTRSLDRSDSSFRTKSFDLNQWRRAVYAVYGLVELDFQGILSTSRNRSLFLSTDLTAVPLRESLHIQSGCIRRC